MYRSCVDAEVSVLVSCHEDCREIQGYYTEPKRAQLRDLIGQLRPSAPRLPHHRADRDSLVSRAVWGRVLPQFLARFLCRKQERWLFLRRETNFIAACFESLLDYLASDTKPPVAQLWDLRMDLCYCQLFIELRCWGLAELDQISRAEYFKPVKPAAPRTAGQDAEFKQSA
jgi:hypothetical protein